MFIDLAVTKNLPDERLLSMFIIVLTSTQRLTNEWENGSFEEELKSEFGRFFCPSPLENPSTGACSPLKFVGEG